MEDSKYYTPNISEFYPCFEYEMKERFMDGVVKTQKQFDESNWISCIYTLGEGPYLERTMFGNNPHSHPSAIRVKYLDKEDIESLGFKYYGTRNYHTLNGIEESGFLKKLEDDSNVYIKCFLDKDDKVTSQLDITSTDVFTYDTSTPWDAYCEGGCGPSAQQIRIKNKSELKVLLKQLGIDE